LLPRRSTAAAAIGNKKRPLQNAYHALQGTVFAAVPPWLRLISLNAAYFPDDNGIAVPD